MTAWIKKAWRWIAIGAGLVVAGVLASLEIRRRNANRELSEKTIDLAENAVEHEIAEAELEIREAEDKEEEVSNGKIDEIRREVADEVASGDLGSALDKLGER